MPLTALRFQPGIVRDVPAYTNKGGWFDANLVRFRLGFPETMGGWHFAIFGGAWTDGAVSGSRDVNTGTATTSASTAGSRGVCDHLILD